MSLKSIRAALKSIRVRIAIPVNYAATIGVPYALAQKIATPRNPPKNESLFLGVKKPNQARNKNGAMVRRRLNDLRIDQLGRVYDIFLVSAANLKIAQFS